jgi:amidohydrolase
MAAYVKLFLALILLSLWLCYRKKRLPMTSSQPVTYAELLERAKAMHEQIRAWRREIHRHPELSFTEQRTAGLVNATLVSLGIPTETEVAKTGVVGHIRGGAGGPVVGLRADMDALPITEINGTEFDSTRPGIMHACGHDAHTAMLLGAATLLKGLADEERLPGSIRLLFQPSEETPDTEGKTGARRMVEEGALKGLDAVFALHVMPSRDVGEVATREGPILAISDRFHLVIRGSGGHAGLPQNTIDPIALSTHVINAIQQVVSRRINPLEPASITISTIHGGTVDGLIPDTVILTGSIRSFTPETRKKLHEELEKACRIVEPLGGSIEFTIKTPFAPLSNSPEATRVAVDALSQMLGKENVKMADQRMAAEDFSFMAEVAPACFIFLGVHDPAWGDKVYPVHRGNFRMDEDALPVGSAVLAATALNWMNQKQ